MKTYFDEKYMHENIILVKFEKDYQNMITCTSYKMKNKDAHNGNRNSNTSDKIHSYNQTNDNNVSELNQGKEKENYKNMLFNTNGNISIFC